jgi:hypothetical protein
MAEKLLLNDPGDIAGTVPPLLLALPVDVVVVLLELPHPAATRPATAAIAAPRIKVALMLRSPSFVGFAHSDKRPRDLSMVVNTA